MPNLEAYRKHAKLLVRWHGEGNYSVGGKLRLLHRYRHLTDHEALDMPLPLTLAQEIVAVEAGFPTWAALKAGMDGLARPRVEPVPLALKRITPILFVRDVTATAAWYGEKLGFTVDFLHGNPPFYGSMSRDGLCLHLRFVHQPNFAELAAREGSLILATIEVSNVKAMFEELGTRGVAFAQGLVKQAWGGTDFHVRDPDGNVLSFVQYRPAAVL
ncbi:MAG: glyoxalase superfamily protein [Sphingomonas sp.]|jgi:catechol 2,3-dioxygenase-like lactoylglutathione lyase family enzyme|uniref:glyoxalase superfamily protein n=1 Tax=Sphingomonas sp. TaxID=28214 RepID=UPI0035636528